MKPLTAVLAVIAMVVFPVGALACVTIAGPFSWGGVTWYTYEFDPNCASRSGNVTVTTLSNGTPGLAFGTGSSTATYAYTIGATDPVLSNWSVDMLLEWNDPNGSIYNNLSASVGVTHNGTTTTWIFSVNGTVTKNLTRELASFSAQSGDTITINIYGLIYNNNVTAKVGRPVLFTTHP